LCSSAAPVAVRVDVVEQPHLGDAAPRREPIPALEEGTRPQELQLARGWYLHSRRAPSGDEVQTVERQVGESLVVELAEVLVDVLERDLKLVRSGASVEHSAQISVNPPDVVRRSDCVLDLALQDSHDARFYASVQNSRLAANAA
jgi:hypothetical protein